MGIVISSRFGSEITLPEKLSASTSSHWGTPRCLAVSRDSLILVIFLLFPLTLYSLIFYEIHGGRRPDKMSWIGDITYSSYLLHFPLNLTLVSMVSLGCLPRGFHLNPSCFVVYFFILIAISLLTFYKVERPLKNLIRQSFGFPAR